MAFRVRFEILVTFCLLFSDRKQKIRTHLDGKCHSNILKSLRCGFPNVPIRVEIGPHRASWKIAKLGSPFEFTTGRWPKSSNFGCGLVHVRAFRTALAILSAHFEMAVTFLFCFDFSGTFF